MNPIARQAGLLHSKIEDEVVVFDPERQTYAGMNKVAGFIWLQADGTKTTADLAELVQSHIDPAANEDVVLMALHDLEAAGLLEEGVSESHDVVAARRRFLRKVARVGALASLIPAVDTVLTPTSAHAKKPSKDSGTYS